VVEPAAAKRPAKATAATFGKTVAAPFGAAAKLKIGMGEADAKQAAPAFWAGGALATVNGSDDDLAYKLTVEAGRVTGIEISSKSYDRLTPLVVAAWGPGLEAKNTLGGGRTVWFSPELGTRASAESSTLKLEEYLPLETLLGPDKVAIAALPKPILGATFEDLKRDYGPLLLKPDAEVKALYLPPTEWNTEHTEVYAMILERTHKVTDYSFTVDDAAYPGGKDASLAAFTKKWGKPRMAKSYGSTKDTMIFHADNPLIEVDREPGVYNAPGGSGWQVRVRPHDDACGGPCYH
jgi:hypothetical protein